jgi:predicted metal-binding protein
MKKINSPFEKHIFVCCNSREDGTGCASLGGEKIREKLKSQIFEQGYKKIRANKSGCLGFCENGVVIAVYPEGKVFLDAKEGEVNLQDLISSEE